MTDQPACRLCRADLSPVIAESAAWRLILNREQDLLGKCFIAARRHVELPTALDPPEWADLLDVVRGVERRLRAAFQPDHFNFAFLGNIDRHLHLHVMPRYAAPRTVDGVDFTDDGWPGHYALRAGPHLNAAQLERLADRLR